MTTGVCPRCGGSGVVTYGRLGRPPKVARHEWPTVVQLYTEEGFTLQQIGDRFGVTRERIRQIVAELEPGAKQHHQEVRDWASVQRQFERRADTARPCSVCSYWVLRGAGGWRTCSPQCAERWRVARYQLDSREHERHRVHMARSVLRHPSSHPPSYVAWAKKMLSDTPPPPNRRFLVPGRKPAKVLEEVQSA